MAAATQVFEIAELVEMIFVFLPIKSLFVARNISRSTQAIVKASKKLQRAMWLTPASGNPVAFVPGVRIFADNLCKQAQLGLY